MNAEIGHFALILAFAVAIFQMVVPMIGAHKGWTGWIEFRPPGGAGAIRPDRHFIRGADHGLYQLGFLGPAGL